MMDSTRSSFRSPTGLARTGLLLFGLILVTLLAKAHVGKIPEAGPELSGGPAESGFQSPPDPSPGARINPNFGRLPLIFEPNQGQTDSRVKFLCRTPGATVFLTANEAVFTFPSGGPGESPARRGTIAADRRNSGRGVFPGEGERPVGFDPLQRSMIGLGLREPWKDPASLENSPGMARPSRRQPAWARGPSALRMQLVEANAQAEIEGLERLSGVSNYFIGNDPGKWRTKVPHYAKVRYRDVYPGIDLVYYGNERNLEYDFVLRPGADPNLIRLAFEGTDGIEVDQKSGDLLVKMDSIILRQFRPRVYQVVGKRHLERKVAFLVKDPATVAFKVESFDPGTALVIDPVIGYSSYLGGVEPDRAQSVAVDKEGNVYLAGITASADFPTTPLAPQPNHSGTTCGGIPPGPCEQAFVAKLSATGDAILYSTFLGGTVSVPDFPGGDRAYGLAVDAMGAAYVGGSTQSADFPMVNAIQAQNRGGEDGFAVKLDSTGSALLYSTYLGGSDFDGVLGVAASDDGAAVLTGYRSTDFPLSSTSHRSFGEGKGAFVVKLDQAGSRLTYSAFIGACTGYAISIDADGSAYVTGDARPGFPVTNATQGTFAGANDIYGDAFLFKLDPTGNAMLFSTYLGGSGSDYGVDLALDPSGDIAVTGLTRSKDFPTTATAFERTYEGFGKQPVNHFVTKFNPAGEVVYSTYLLSLGRDWSFRAGIAMDSGGNAWVAGSTSSPDFPLFDPLQSVYGGSVDRNLEAGGDLEDFDAFLVQLDPSGSRLLFSTFLGGTRADHAHAIAMGSNDSVYVAGATRSDDFPILQGVQASYGGNDSPPYGGNLGDAFVLKLMTIPQVTLSQSTTAFATDGGGGAISVSAPPGLSWKATSQADWITVDSGQAGVGNGTVVYSISPTALNAPKRQGTIVIAGRVFTVVQEPEDLFVPVILSVAGLNGAFFTSELTFTNRSRHQDASLEITYTASPQFPGGGGTVSVTLPAGRQRVVADGIAFLRALGLPLSEGGQHLGTLRIRVSGTPVSELGVTVRTTTPVPNGRAGLSYSAIRTSQLLTETAYLCGLQQTATDRSNVALQNAGRAEDGDVVLRLTVFSGHPALPLEKALAEQRLSPGEFRQISGILHAEGLDLSSGYVRVERISGTAPFYAYAVVNDQGTSDGSFVTPRTEAPTELAVNAGGWWLPVVVKTRLFSSEAILTNFSSEKKFVQARYRAEAIQNESKSISHELELAAGEQLIIPDFVQYLREKGVAVLEDSDRDYAGALFVSPRVASGRVLLEAPDRFFAGARTSTQGANGRYGVFYAASDSVSQASVWLSGLQQTSETRTNLALLHLGGAEEQSGVFRIELYDGATGLRVGNVDRVALARGQWLQINSVLANYSSGVEQAYARVVPIDGNGPFIAYAVVNDGAVPGQRSGDGAFVMSSP
ncbi:MAG: SBBP repeat-containing protein [Acidobacteriota bacterium]